ncbi:N-acetylglucosamine-6-phosphate deacetylase [Silvanigrella aquatica]|uniref:N-acetylglucosamine-6-phosphate deacetylase n=1 Tax=Silvanigrella aquatica TaxID=1915309 RepID=A0A1L4CZ85_9BACT|nr:N-acetylglucosamine-6-phosphate deacetylase [Silvanigrella aquatica]APJ03245.1 N-acetylglucosamine-6-phosphate deacetylase [Silvanigrella aquatica]
MFCLANALVFNGEKFLKKKQIYIKDNSIADISSKKNTKKIKEIDLNGNILCPGFIDIQLNGGGGVFFNESQTISGLKQIMQAHLSFGTTSFLPTFITDDNSKIILAINCINKAIQQKIPGILGVHLEGPYLNKDKKGIHPVDFIRTPSEDKIDYLFQLISGIKLITLAPEKINHEFLKKLIKNNFIIFAGHSNATCQQMKDAFSLGVKGITHLFNACSPLGSREPGIVGAALLNDEIWCGIIADGHHVCFDTLKLAFKAKSKRKFILVSDAMAPIGTNLKEFYIGNNKIFVKEGKYLDAAGTLAGSAITVYDALLNIYQNNLASLEETLQMTSTNAAQCLGIDNPQSSIKKGRILPGFDADFVVLEKNTLKIMHVFQEGKLHAM